VQCVLNARLEHSWKQPSLWRKFFECFEQPVACTPYPAPPYCKQQASQALLALSAYFKAIWNTGDKAYHKGNKFDINNHKPAGPAACPLQAQHPTGSLHKQHGFLYIKCPCVHAWVHVHSLLMIAHFKHFVSHFGATQRRPAGHRWPPCVAKCWQIKLLGTTPRSQKFIFHVSWDGESEEDEWFPKLGTAPSPSQL